MALLRKRLADLTEEENLLYRALCGELEEIAQSLADEAACPKPDLMAIAAAQRDRRLAVQWLRRFHLPPAAVFSDGPSEQEEELLLREAVQ